MIILKWIIVTIASLSLIPMAKLVKKMTGDSELSRKFMHTTSQGVILYASLVVFDGTFSSVLVPFAYAVISYFLVWTGILDNCLRRKDGNDNMNSILYVSGAYLLLAQLTLIDYHFKIPFALGALALMIGDSVAALIGKNFGKYSKKFKNGKSVIGSLAFVLSSLLCMFILVTVIGYNVAIWKLVVLSIIGAFMELYSDDFDNILIPITVAFSAYLLLF